MTRDIDTASLAGMHTPEAIARRISSAKQPSYLGDLVLGAIDGTVTTFAIVAGAAGANLPTTVALVLGIANIVADAFSMGASNYLKSRSDREFVDKMRRVEELHIDLVPDAEREETRQIFAAKGFSGDTLEEVVEVITSDREQWVDTMLAEEWGLNVNEPSALKAAVATFFAFVCAGFVPLLPLLFAIKMAAANLFLTSALLTMATFFAIGLLRGKLTQRRPLATAIETLLIGGVAAAMAYFVGVFLRDAVTL